MRNERVQWLMTRLHTIRVQSIKSLCPKGKMK